jgi:hypothetical protein
MACLLFFPDPLLFLRGNSINNLVLESFFNALRVFAAEVSFSLTSDNVGIGRRLLG